MARDASLSPEIYEALARGRTLLTGNQRAARTLRLEADLAERTAGRSSWTPAPIFAWDAWTATLWHDLLLGGQATLLLLNAAQEHTLWQNVIAEDARNRSLVPSESLAMLAAEAWGLLCAYGGKDRLRTQGASFQASVDTRAFARWAQGFDDRCRAGKLLPRAELEAALTQAMTRKQLRLSAGGYFLAGFDRTTPAQQALLSAMRGAGIPIEYAVPGTPAAGPRLLQAAHPAEELDTAARALRRHLEQHPAAQVALIVPALGSRRAEIDRVLRNTLAPESNDLTVPSVPAPFEFSLGVPLIETPPVAAALDLLRWAVDPLPLGRIGDLLLSPHIAAGAELPARAACDAYLLRRQTLLRPELSLEKLIRILAGSRESGRMPKLLAALRALDRTRRELTSPELRSHAEWTDAVRSLLQAAGWETLDDSIAFQTHRRWESVLDELATLDFTGVRVSFPEALAAIARLALQTLFAPESRNAPVQVLGPLEAAGSTFDAVWVLGAGDRGWPAGASTSPLLSWQLQRELGMPGTHPERDLAHARRIAARLVASAKTVVFSYPREFEEAQQRPSAALGLLALAAVTPADLDLPAAGRAPIALEAFEDSTPLPPLPARPVRGGATILKHQAACGFRAFAEHRLWSTALPKVEFGMDARERGSDVHEILEDFWKQVASQDHLQALSTSERQTILNAAIDRALAPESGAAEGWDAPYLQVQHERLLLLLDSWLRREMDRDVPFLVKSSETEMRDVAIGPLRLSLRVDRVDETEFGDVILDYKTGAAHPDSWLSDRPDEPQLPLYAVLAASAPGAAPLAGVGFAEVRAGRDMALRGFETQKGIFAKSAENNGIVLEDQVDAWRSSLIALAEDFHRGDVRVRPKAYPHTCQFCEQRLLCRLDISLLEAPADEPEEEANGRG